MLYLNLINAFIFRFSIKYKQCKFKKYHLKDPRKKKASGQADRQCIIHVREEAKGDVKRFLLNSLQVIY